MIAEKATLVQSVSWSQKMRDYNELVKMRLNLLVVFSSVISFAMASSGNINWMQMPCCHWAVFW